MNKIFMLLRQYFSKTPPAPRYAVELPAIYAQHYSQEELDFLNATLSFLATKKQPKLPEYPGESLAAQVLKAITGHHQGVYRKEIAFLLSFQALAQTQRYRWEFDQWEDACPPPAIALPRVVRIAEVRDEFIAIPHLHPLYGQLHKILQAKAQKEATALAEAKARAHAELTEREPQQEIQRGSPEPESIATEQEQDAPTPTSAQELVEVPSLEPSDEVSATLPTDEDLDPVISLSAEDEPVVEEQPALELVPVAPPHVVAQQEPVEVPPASSEQSPEPETPQWRTTMSLLEQDEYDVATQFLKLLPAVRFKTPKLKGKSHGWKKGNRLYLMEIAIRDLILGELSEEDKRKYKRLDKEVHALSLALFSALEKLQWLVTSHENVKCLKEIPFWEVKIGDLPFKGVFVVDLPEELMHLPTAGDTTYPIEVLRPQYLRPKSSAVKSRDSLTAMGLLK